MNKRQPVCNPTGGQQVSSVPCCNNVTMNNFVYVALCTCEPAPVMEGKCMADSKNREDKYPY